MPARARSRKEAIFPLQRGGLAADILVGATPRSVVPRSRSTVVKLDAAACVAPLLVLVLVLGSCSRRRGRRGQPGMVVNCEGSACELGRGHEGEARGMRAGRGLMTDHTSAPRFCDTPARAVIEPIAGRSIGALPWPARGAAARAVGDPMYASVWWRTAARVRHGSPYVDDLARHRLVLGAVRSPSSVPAVDRAVVLRVGEDRW